MRIMMEMPSNLEYQKFWISEHVNFYSISEK